MTVETFEDIKVADQNGRLTLGNRYAGRHFILQERPDGSTLLTPVLAPSEAERPAVSYRLGELFSRLEALDDNWDGYGSKAPSPALVSAARETVALLQSSAISHGLRWFDPHVGSNERGEVILEWWQDNRNLTLYVRSADRIDYLKSWGVNIQAEMEDGELERVSDFVSLSQWLYDA